ncbi:MAG: hypothetical protein HY901_23580 [Deltaproteobacteria bacterium]|nr:hypothetical protein [Deltaproteobacteria bacterium]
MRPSRWRPRRPPTLKAAPTCAFRGRLDEVKAARKPILRWKPGLKID